MNVTQADWWIKQMLHHIIITITTTTEFQFWIPETFQEYAEEMVNDKSFFEKIKQCMVEESLKDTPLPKEEMTSIFTEVMSKYSVEKCLRLFGYFFCGTYAKHDYPTLIQMSDGFVCSFYKFYKEDPTSDFVFGVRRFVYSPEVVNCGLFISTDLMKQEVGRIGSMITDTMNTLANHSTKKYVGNEFEWMATTVVADVKLKTADQVMYLISTMGRTTMFDRPDKMNIFLDMVDALWDSHCSILAEHNKPKQSEGNTSSVH